MTSCLLYSLVELGFQIDILQFGINVIMDVINLAVDIREQSKSSNNGVECIDLADCEIDEIEG